MIYNCLIKKQLTPKIKQFQSYIIKLHYSLGLWIRNNWIYKGDLSYEVLTGQEAPEFKEGMPFPYITTSADDISSKFLVLYHKHLKKTFKA